MYVSVIIPAHNAAETLADALDSLLAQTIPSWEAIVVDDGSMDETARIASDFAARDPRIQFVTQPQAGEAGARNTGIRLARFDWMAFLDADDWLLPRYLERLTARLEADSSLDAAICGWTRVAPDGTVGVERYCSQPDDVFDLSTRSCPFAIHACVVRRSLVDQAGGFDTAFPTCADWDFWQRVARLGARFGAIPEVLTRYRMRPDSAGLNGPQLLCDGLRIIERGHSSDPRVKRAAPEYAQGAPREMQARAEYHYCSWAAGILIGASRDATQLLGSFVRPESDLDPHQVALSLFESVLLPGCRLPSEWPAVWPAHEPLVDRFLFELEARSLAPGIAVRSRRLLERLILNRVPLQRPLAVGQTYAVKLEITQPIPNIKASAPIDRLFCEIEIEGKSLGSLELPVCDGLVPAYVLADAVAAKFAWPILGEFWRRTLYRQFEVRRQADEISIWRDGTCLASGLPEDEASLWSQVHNQIGWKIFSDQLWRIAAEARPQKAENGWFLAEASAELPLLETDGDTVTCVPAVGGVPLGIVTVTAHEGVVAAEQLRGVLLDATGFESCRAAVREGLLGNPLDAQPLSLLDRLKNRPGPGSTSACRNLEIGEALLARLSAGLPAAEGKIVFGPRLFQPIATSASRRAMFPAEAAQHLLQTAAGRQAVLCLTPEGEQPSRIVYAPDLISASEIRPPAQMSDCRENTSGRPSPLLSSFGKSTARRPAVLVDESIVTDRLPILMYHRVAPKGDPRMARYRIGPRAFEEQLHYLQQAGYCSVTLEHWRLAMKNERPLPGRAVLFTFDDGYVDFQSHAWPLLRRYGFSATLFVVADEVGRTNRWDHSRTQELPLLGWKQLRALQNQGVEIGSHSASHLPLNVLPPVEIVREAARSRAILERELGRHITAFAYPYGAHDEAVQHLVGACGYIFGLSCDFKLSGFFDPLLALPRVEIMGSDRLQDFVQKIEGVAA